MWREAGGLKSTLLLSALHHVNLSNLIWDLVIGSPGSRWPNNNEPCKNEVKLFNVVLTLKIIWTTRNMFISGTMTWVSCFLISLASLVTVSYWSRACERSLWYESCCCCSWGWIKLEFFQKIAQFQWIL